MIITPIVQYHEPDTDQEIHHLVCMKRPDVAFCGTDVSDHEWCEPPTKCHVCYDIDDHYGRPVYINGQLQEPLCPWTGLECDCSV